MNAPHLALLAVVAGLSFLAVLVPGSPATGADPTPPTLTWELSADVPGALSDDSVRLYAWQSFIALNWPADVSKPGSPDKTKKLGDVGPVVWQTYRAARDVFLPDAAKPAAWGKQGTLPSAFAALQERRDKFQLRVMTEPSKVAAGANVAHVIDKVPEWKQASNGRPWLTDRYGQVVWYEFLMNEDEFNYIVRNEFYDATRQRAAMEDGKSGISLPAGKTVDGEMGAIEIKAAWRVMPDDPAEVARYHTTDALVLKDPPNGTVGGFVQVKLGLVGLHIIHKTRKAPQFIWATFEHVDNCPNDRDKKGDRKYSFYDPANIDPPNIAPLPTQALTKPIQVTREVPITEKIQQLNTATWKVIGQAWPDSVWLNYQLIDAQWPQNGTTVPAREKVPLTAGGPTPQLLSNTTAETYVQRRLNCLDCHRNATIGATAVDRSPAYAADYSFLFSMAKEKP